MTSTHHTDLAPTMTDLLRGYTDNAAEAHRILDYETLEAAVIAAVDSAVRALNLTLGELSGLDRVTLAHAAACHCSYPRSIKRHQMLVLRAAVVIAAAGWDCRPGPNDDVHGEG